MEIVSSEELVQWPKAQQYCSIGGQHQGIQSPRDLGIPTHSGDGGAVWIDMVDVPPLWLQPQYIYLTMQKGKMLPSFCQ